MTSSPPGRISENCENLIFSTDLRKGDGFRTVHNVELLNEAIALAK
jgi:hypothetical protein